MEEVLQRPARRRPLFLLPSPAPISARSSWWWALGLMIALVAGIAFRLIWVEDVEYKLDEAWTYQKVQAMGCDEPIPLVGMPTSYGPPNPGLSLWTMWVLARAFAVESPLELARACQVLNVVALFALVGFVLLSIPRTEREPWLWAAALGAVNPMAVLFQRKIWPPSLGPLFGVAWLAGWWHRRHPAGAFVWGVVGAMLGQFHAMGFFLAAGLVLFTVLFPRRDVRWKAWYLGSVVGSLPMLPWLYVLATEPTPLHSHNVPRLHRLAEGKFWTHWASEPFGVGLDYSLGNEYQNFLAGPHWGEQPCYLVGVCQGLCVVLGVIIVCWGIWSHWRDSSNWRKRLLGGGSESGFLTASVLWGFGLLLSVCCLRFYRHYLILAYPLPLLWAALLALRTKRGRVLLAALWLSQFLLTASFLHYVHTRGDCIDGDYRMPYGVQRQRGQVHDGEI